MRLIHCRIGSLTIEEQEQEQEQRREQLARVRTASLPGSNPTFANCGKCGAPSEYTFCGSGLNRQRMAKRIGSGWNQQGESVGDDGDLGGRGSQYLAIGLHA